MDGQTQAIDPNKQAEEVVPDYEVIEEGSPEAKKLAEGDDAADDEGEDDQPDARLTTQRTQDKDDVSRQPGENTDKRRKQRQRIKDKLDAKDALISSVQQQNRQLNERLNRLESRTGSNEIAMIDKAINDTKELVTMAEQQHAHSLTQNDPMQVTRSMRELFGAEQRLQALVNTREQAVRMASAPRAIDGNQQRNVSAWMARNPWFRPETGDEDSRIAKVLDDQIASEGFDPSTPAYWAELDRRIKRKLPNRAAGGNGRQQVNNDLDDDEGEEEPVQQARMTQDQQTQRRSHVGGSGQGAGGGGRVKVTLSRERVQALKDAGKWDDTVERNKMIKAYVKYDRDQTQTR